MSDTGPTSRGWSFRRSESARNGVPPPWGCFGAPPATLRQIHAISHERTRSTGRESLWFASRGGSGNPKARSLVDCEGSGYQRLAPGGYNLQLPYALATLRRDD